MKSILHILFFCLLLQFTYSQDNKIQKVDFSDSIVNIAVKDFIKRRLIEYQKFNSYGYIILRLVSYNEITSKNKPIVIYKIIDQYYSLDSGFHKYPNSYTYISDKLVLIYDNWSKLTENNSLSERSKRKIRRKINKTLGKPEHVFFKDENGKVIIDDKNFRPETSHNIHGGIFLSIYKDGTYKVNTAYNNGYK